MSSFGKKFFVALMIAVTCVIVGGFLVYEADIPLEQLRSKYTNSESKFAEVDGLNVHYRVEGNGPALVLIHGTGSMLQTWDDWTTILSPHFKIVRMDIPAFGLTGPRSDGNYSDEMYAGFVEKFVLQLGLDTFYLAGNSLGGSIAWNYASKYPQKVKGLVLVDPGGFYDAEKKSGALVFTMAKNFPGFSALVSKMGTHYFAADALRDAYEDDSKITEAKKLMYAELNCREGNRRAFIQRAQFVRNHNEEELKSISAPVLIMWGREDKLIDVSAAEHFKKLTAPTFVFYDKVGHMPQEEIPERSAADVFRFLKKGLPDN